MQTLVPFRPRMKSLKVNGDLSSPLTGHPTSSKSESSNGGPHGSGWIYELSVKLSSDERAGYHRTQTSIGPGPAVAQLSAAASSARAAAAAQWAGPGPGPWLRGLGPEAGAVAGAVLSPSN